jgi:WD40 repeat protein
VAVVNRTTLRNPYNLTNQTGAAHAVTSNTKRVFVGSFDSKIYVYNISNSFTCSHVLANATNQIKFVYTYKDLLCSASQDGKLRIYNATTLRMIRQINDSNATSLLSCNIDDKYIYSGGVAERLWVYNKTTLALIKTFRIKTGNYIRQIVSDKQFIYAGGDERLLYTIKYPQLTWYKNISMGQNIVTIEQDNQYLVMGHGTGTYEVSVMDKLLWRTTGIPRNTGNLSNGLFKNSSIVTSRIVAYGRNESTTQDLIKTIWINGTALPATPTPSTSTDAHVLSICNNSFAAYTLMGILLVVIIGVLVFLVIQGMQLDPAGMVAAVIGLIIIVIVGIIILSGLCA